MTDGLHNVRYAVLKQEVDPLEWCVCTLPFPAKLGIPCLPCELPNEFFLFQSNESYTQLGMKIWDFKEESNCIQRTICCPSMRSFSMTSKDFYSEVPVTAQRPFSIPFSRKHQPELVIHQQNRYIGKIVEPIEIKCLSGVMHELKIYNEEDELIYTLRAKLNSNCCLCLPQNVCKNITYKIIENTGKENGEIQHLFYGFFNELCSKADQYGITFPEESSLKQKTLVCMAAIFIDYLLFENS